VVEALADLFRAPRSESAPAWPLRIPALFNYFSCFRSLGTAVRLYRGQQQDLNLDFASASEDLSQHVGVGLFLTVAI
jgi:hypothetical protein